MDPITLGTAALTIIEEAIKVEPAVAAALKNLFSKPNPTPEDWQAERAAVLSKRYRDLVPDTQLPDA